MRGNISHVNLYLKQNNKTIAYLNFKHIIQKLRPKLTILICRVSLGSWKNYEEDLSKNNITMIKTNEDLVGKIWTTGRPSFPNSPINALPYRFAGLKNNKYYILLKIIFAPVNKYNTIKATIFRCCIISFLIN